MEQFLRQLQTIPEAAELIRRVEEGVSGNSMEWFRMEFM